MKTFSLVMWSGCAILVALMIVTTRMSDPITKSAGWTWDKQAWLIDTSKDAIRAKLRDPDSAQFRNVKFYSGGGAPVVCGEVNGKNGFGGRAGYQRFIQAGDVFGALESEMRSTSDMDQSWLKFFTDPGGCAPSGSPLTARLA